MSLVMWVLVFKHGKISQLLPPPESATSSNHSFQTCTKTKDWPCESHLGGCKMLSCHTHMLEVSIDYGEPHHCCRGLGLFNPAPWPPVQHLIEHGIYWAATPGRNDLARPCVLLGLQKGYHAFFHEMDPGHILILAADPQTWHHLWRELDCNQEDDWCTQPSSHHGSVHQISWYILQQNRCGSQAKMCHS